MTTPSKRAISKACWYSCWKWNQKTFNSEDKYANKSCFLQHWRRTFGSGLPDRSSWTKLQEVLGIRILHVCAAEDSSKCSCLRFCKWPGWPAALCCWPDCLWHPGKEGGLSWPEWSLLVSTLILQSFLQFDVCLHLYLPSSVFVYVSEWSQWSPS